MSASLLALWKRGKRAGRRARRAAQSRTRRQLSVMAHPPPSAAPRPLPTPPHDPFRHSLHPLARRVAARPRDGWAEMSFRFGAVRELIDPSIHPSSRIGDSLPSFRVLSPGSENRSFQSFRSVLATQQRTRSLMAASSAEGYAGGLGGGVRCQNRHCLRARCREQFRRRGCSQQNECERRDLRVDSRAGHL